MKKLGVIINRKKCHRIFLRGLRPVPDNYEERMRELDLEILELERELRERSAQYVFGDIPLFDPADLLDMEKAPWPDEDWDKVKK